MIQVKQGFVSGYPGSKILGGCKKGVTYTTTEERMGYRNLERIHVFSCILGRKVRDSENKIRHAWLCATFFSYFSYLLRFIMLCTT